MSRRTKIILLGLGALLGFSAGAFHLIYGPGCAHHGPWSQRRAEFERHVAAVCTTAARDVFRAERTGAATPEADGP